MSVAAAAAAAATPVVRIRNGATGFDAKTGGVHAEGLLKYGCYAGDVFTGVIAGHSVEICDLSARLTAAGGGASEGAVAPTDPRLHAMLAAGIPPSQGLLRPPPPPPLPTAWRAWTAYLFPLALAVAGGLEYLHQRSTYHALRVSGATVGAGAGAGASSSPAYPIVVLSGQGVLQGEQPLSSAVAVSQSFCLLLLVAWFAILSGLLQHRAVPWSVHPPWRNKAWAPGVATALLLQLVFAHVLGGVRYAPSVHPSLFGGGVPWDAWLAGAAGLCALGGAASLLKDREGAVWTRRMKSLRLAFDTRLGMYSPR